MPWARCWTSPATRAGAGSRRRTARTRTSPPSSGCAYVRGLQGSDVAEGVLATGKHMVGHGLRRGRAQPGAGARRDARAARRAAAPVRGRGPDRRPGEHDAGLLRRGRRAMPRLAGAPDHDPARRVGVRRHRRLRLHRDPDALDPAPADRRPGGRRRASPCRAGVDSELPKTAVYGQPLVGGAGRRTARRGPGRRRGPADAAHEVPARPVRAAVRRRCRTRPR